MDAEFKMSFMLLMGLITIFITCNNRIDASFGSGTCDVPKCQGAALGINGISSQGANGHAYLAHCSNCNAVYYGPIISHSFGNWNNNGTSGHSRTCMCGYTEVGWHSLVDIDYGRRCTVCGYEEITTYSEEINDFVIVGGECE